MAVPRGVDAIDWAVWRAVDLCTLVFVVRDGQVLLIRKKRGLGAGKVNGPGGRIEPGETPVECAVREVEEEVGVTPLGLAETGELRFQFADGYSTHVFAFRARGCRGVARETPEAVPLWTPLPKLPYDEMWEDDRVWLPHLLAGRPFEGRFVFDGDALLDHAFSLRRVPVRSARSPASAGIAAKSG
jgi:8-oxo-dGTP diphosphatase